MNEVNKKCSICKKYIPVELKSSNLPYKTCLKCRERAKIIRLRNKYLSLFPTEPPEDNEILVSSNYEEPNILDFDDIPNHLIGLI